MNMSPAHQALTWIRTALRDPMLICLGVSGAVHAGVIAYAVTREPLHEEALDAGGTVAVAVVVIEGPEQHPGTQSGEDRERAAAPADAAKTGATPPEDAMAATAATTPVDPDSAVDRARRERQRDATPAVQPAAARLAAEPQPGDEAVAAMPVAAPPPVADQPEPVRHAAEAVPIPPPKPRPPDARTEQRPATADAAPNADATDTPAAVHVATKQPDTRRPLVKESKDSAPSAHAGGTRGAAPVGDNPKPVYPFGARRRGEEGRVVLRVTVLSNGNAAAVDVAETSGFGRLDKAALETVRRWRFVPARRGGIPVATEVTVPIRFELR